MLLNYCIQLLKYYLNFEYFKCITPEFAINIAFDADMELNYE